ncbi:MAG: ABC transporter permease [Alloprevotella sp.]|nr:ABC transporter permease [Alloprevotella sp.]
MNKIFIIIQREFLKRVNKKSFIIMTLLMPFLMAALVFVPLWLSTLNETGDRVVYVVDKTGRYSPSIVSTSEFTIVPVADMLPEFKNDSCSAEAILVIDDDLVKNPSAATIYSKKEVKPDLLRYVEMQLNEHIRKDKLEASGIPQLEKIIDNIETTISVSTIKWDKSGNESESSTGVAMVAGFLVALLIYMFVLIYGAMVMQSVMEEKTNRIVELMVSSVKPFQLMMGKIIGIALVGFLQIIIWGVMLAVILSVGMAMFGGDAASATAAAQMGPGMAMTAQPEIVSETAAIQSAIANLPFFELGVMFILSFVGGYLLYASLYAAIGASVNEQEDSQQFMMPMMLIMIFALYAAMYSIENPDGPLAFWCSMIPLTSPVVMVMRVPFGVPFWQELLSMIILFAADILLVWLAGKIYRVGILMYGKKPTWKDLAKWVRYK